jgi:hypothetical protein
MAKSKKSIPYPDLSAEPQRAGCPRLSLGIAASELIHENNEAAIDWALKPLAAFNHHFLTYIVLAAALASLDRMEEAALRCARCVSSTRT